MSSIRCACGRWRHSVSITVAGMDMLGGPGIVKQTVAPGPELSITEIAPPMDWW